MKVLIFKSYQKNEKVSYNYGDDIEDIWHNFNIVEETREMTLEDFEVLKRAISYFNSKKCSLYKIDAVVVLDDDEFNNLITDYNKYEELESSHKIKQEIAQRAKLEADREKLEASKVKRTVKKLAKELNISEDEVLVILAKKN